MILYHFTRAEFLKSIMRQELCRGDVRTKQIGPLFETNAVWLTTDPQPKGHGLGLPAHSPKKTACGISWCSERCPRRSLVIRTKELFVSLWTFPRKILACGGGLVGHARIAS